MDTAEVGRFFRDAVAKSGGAEHIMMRIWEAGETLRVERREPLTTHSGKVLHVFKANGLS